MNKKISTALGGFLIGVVNSIFGAGGGIIAVPVLKAQGLEKREAHANAVAVILPISIISAALYLARGNVKISDAVPFIPTGLLGAALGTVALRKISPKLLKRIFGIFIIYAGVRLLLK